MAEQVTRAVSELGQRIASLATVVLWNKLGYSSCTQREHLLFEVDLINNELRMAYISS